MEKIKELFSRLGADKTGLITYGMFEDTWITCFFAASILPTEDRLNFLYPLTIGWQHGVELILETFRA